MRGDKVLGWIAVLLAPPGAMLVVTGDAAAVGFGLLVIVAIVVIVSRVRYGKKPPTEASFDSLSSPDRRGCITESRREPFGGGGWGSRTWGELLPSGGHGDGHGHGDGPRITDHGPRTARRVPCTVYRVP